MGSGQSVAHHPNRLNGVERANLPLYLLVAAESFHSASQFMPDLDSIDKAAPEDKERAVRRGELYAGVWSFFIALIIAQATNSSIPLFLWLAVTGGTFAIYEYHLRR